MGVNFVSLSTLNSVCIIIVIIIIDGSGWKQDVQK